MTDATAAAVAGGGAGECAHGRDRLAGHHPHPLKARPRRCGVKDVDFVQSPNVYSVRLVRAGHQIVGPGRLLFLKSQANPVLNQVSGMTPP
jgi:hypothetical protein